MASPNERVRKMAYKRGSGCPSCVILLWGSRGREDISEVCKSSSIEWCAKLSRKH